MSRNEEALAEKAKELVKLIGQLAEEAEEEGFGVEFSDTSIRFVDWQSSACYGEADDGFTVDGRGVWYSSGC